jgi:hypothetical protein
MEEDWHEDTLPVFHTSETIVCNKRVVWSYATPECGQPGSTIQGFEVHWLLGCPSDQLMGQEDGHVAWFDGVANSCQQGRPEKQGHWPGFVVEVEDAKQITMAIAAVRASGANGSKCFQVPTTCTVCPSGCG